MTLQAFYDSVKLFQLNFTVTENLQSHSESMAIAINYYTLNPLLPRFIVSHSHFRHCKSLFNGLP